NRTKETGVENRRRKTANRNTVGQSAPVGTPGEDARVGSGQGLKKEQKPVNDVMISSGRIRDFFVKAIFLLTPLLILSTALGLASLAQTAATPAEEEDFAAARHLFDEYKRLDQASDSRLVDFYAPEAKIESDVERKDSPTQKENYDR